MRRHHAVGAVDLGIVEAGLVHAGLQIVGNEEPRDAAEEAEHAHMRADPVRQGLAPGYLREGVARRTQHAEEDLRLADLASLAVDDRQRLAGIVDEHLVAGDMVLAHRGRKPLLETAEQLAEPAVAVAIRMNRAIFLPKDLQGHARPLQLDRQRAPIGFHPPAQALLDALSGE